MCCTVFSGFFAFSGIDVRDVCEEVRALIEQLCKMLHLLKKKTCIFVFVFLLERFFGTGAPVTAPVVEEAKVRVRELSCRGAESDLGTELGRRQWGGEGACPHRRTARPRGYFATGATRGGKGERRRRKNSGGLLRGGRGSERSASPCVKNDGGRESSASAVK